MSTAKYRNAAELHVLLLRLIAEAGWTTDDIVRTVADTPGLRERLTATFAAGGPYTSLDISMILDMIHAPTTAVFGSWPELDAAHTRVIRAAREHTLTLNGVRRPGGPKPLPLAETMAELFAAVAHLDQVEQETD